MPYLVIACTFLVGWWVTAALTTKEPWPFRVSVSWVLGVLLTGWLIFGAVAVSTFQIGIWGSLGTVLSLGLARAWWRRSQKRPVVAFKLDAAVLTPSYVIYSLFWFMLLSYFFVTRMVPLKNGMWYSGGGSWADLAMHIGFISSFAQQKTLSLQSLIYAQENTTYPFMINFYTALLYRGGFSLQAALVMTGLSLSIASTQLLYWLSFKWTKSSVSAWVTSLLFFINGGGGWWYFWHDLQTSKIPLVSFLNSLPKDYTIHSDLNLQWANLITTHLLPQRGFMATLPFFFVCLWLWHEHFSQLKSQKNYLLLLSAAIIGLLPAWYVHTHLMLVGLYFGLAGWSVLTKRSTWKNWLVPTAVLIVLAAPQWWWLETQSSGHQVPYWHIGWMAGQEGLMWFWLKNLGFGVVWWPIVLAWATIHYRKYSYLTCLSWLSTACFIICNVVIFQAYDWNNLKFMLLSYGGMALVFGVMVRTYWSKPWAKIATVIVVTLMTATGWLSLIRESQSNFPLADAHDLELARQVKALTPTSAVFLTAYTHNHPIQMAAGRPVVLGYIGWLWTHGIDYAETQRDVSLIYAGLDEGGNLLKKHHVSYVVIGHWERSIYGPNQAYFDATYPVILNLDDTTIYQVSP